MAGAGNNRAEEEEEVEEGGPGEGREAGWKRRRMEGEAAETN